MSISIQEVEELAREGARKGLEDFNSFNETMAELAIPDRESAGEQRFRKYILIDLKLAQRAIAIQAIRFMHLHAPSFDPDVDSRWSFVRMAIEMGPDYLNFTTAGQLAEAERTKLSSILVRDKLVKAVAQGTTGATPKGSIGFRGRA